MDDEPDIELEAYWTDVRVPLSRLPPRPEPPPSPEKPSAWVGLLDVDGQEVPIERQRVDVPDGFPGVLPAIVDAVFPTYQGPPRTVDRFGIYLTKEGGQPILTAAAASPMSIIHVDSVNVRISITGGPR